MSPIAHIDVRPAQSDASPAAVLDERRRRHWLGPGGLLAALAVAMFVATLTLNPPIAVTGIVLVVAFYTAMLGCAVAVRDIRTRTLAFRWLIGAISVTSLLLLAFTLAIEQFS
ncbi:hypothetical protein [Microbacterium sp. SS28]|uniref:hypothetical protein n=1 Tax=Microbacterium sp. SS28 TaxID=2919948 RepID=UPI001FA9B559|nr:hypothetical protein [Microbacterium sp. SS28]